LPDAHVLPHEFQRVIPKGVAGLERICASVRGANMAHRTGPLHWLMRPQVLLPVLLVAFVAVWLTAFPLWYSHAPAHKTGAVSGGAWLVIDVAFVALFGGALALAAVQWSRSRHKDYPKTKAQEVREAVENEREARQRS
jgi:hypothetical protein